MNEGGEFFVFLDEVGREWFFNTIPKSGEKKSLMPFFLVGCGSGSRGCKTSRRSTINRIHFSIV